MKKTLVIIGFLFLVAGCAAPQPAETRLTFISNIPPEAYAIAHSDLVIGETAMEMGDCFLAYSHYRKAQSTTLTAEVDFFRYLEVLASESCGMNRNAYATAMELQVFPKKFPLPAFHLEEVRKISERLESKVGETEKNVWNRLLRNKEVSKVLDES